MQDNRLVTDAAKSRLLDSLQILCCQMGACNLTMEVAWSPLKLGIFVPSREGNFVGAETDEVFALELRCPSGMHMLSRWKRATPPSRAVDLGVLETGVS